MDIWQIIAGLILMLVGYSIIHEDREYTRIRELEEMERESSPELYNTAEDADPYRPYSELQDIIDGAVGLFYMARGAALCLGGALLLVSGFL